MLEKIIRSKIPQEQLRERERESQTQMWNTHKKDETQIERLMQGFTIEIFWNCLLKQDGDFHWSWCFGGFTFKDFLSSRKQNIASVDSRRSFTFAILLEGLGMGPSHVRFTMFDWEWTYSIDLLI